MTKSDILRVWGRVLRGYRPFLSLEITKECPLHCPGCYAYSPEHLGPLMTMWQPADYRGDELANATLAVSPPAAGAHVIVGGEPLVRYRELSEPLPRLTAWGGSATGDQRRAPHSPGVDGFAATPGRLHRRPRSGT
jgi:hypothetical protein